ncbi:hypothetical protein MPTA5024_25530 [Microbispora sp. ATCC PTA-5024]|nr:hypothetical protein MPTA5024_25530 [Microbispora sp. ATCC PTA-5024]
METAGSTPAPIPGTTGAPTFERMDANILVPAVAAAVFVIYRQTMTRPTERRGILYVAAALVVSGVAGGGLVDSRHLALSLLLVVAELVSAVVFGVVRALTVRVWRDQTGVAWSRGTAWTLAAWAASLAARVALFAAGRVLGVASTTNSILVFVGVTIAVQALAVAWRGRSLPAPSVRPGDAAAVAS